MATLAGWGLVVLSLGTLAAGGGSQEEIAADPLARGRRVYTRGESPRGLALEATIVGGERIPAQALPCIQCHRADGSGGIEGGKTVPDLRPEALGRPRSARGGSERARPAYDDDSLRRAIREGIDPGGVALDPLMPRYVLDEDDLDDLLTYFGLLGRELGPGCDGERVRIATVVPLQGQAGARGRMVARVLGAAMERWNDQGGIHGRRIELVVADSGADPAAALAAARGALEEGDRALALLAPTASAAVPAAFEVLARAGVPVVAPLEVAPEAPTPGAAFWILPSLADQGRAAARHVLERIPEAHVLLRTDDSPGARRYAQAFVAALEARGGSAVEDASTGRVDWMAILGSTTEVERQVSALDTHEPRPRLLLAAVLLGGAPRIDGFGIDLVAAPLGPGWSAGHERFDALRAELPEIAEALHDARAAWAAAELLGHALRVAGRQLTREGLIEALIGVRHLETGVTPPLSFGRSVRVGTRAAVVVSYAPDGSLEDVRLVEPAPVLESGVVR